MSKRKARNTVIILWATTLLLISCSSQQTTPIATSETEAGVVTSAPTPIPVTPTPTPPQVTLGYIGGHYKSPAVLVAPEPGLVIEVFDVTYSTDQVGNGILKRYKVNVKLASGAVMELEFSDVGFSEDGFVDGYTVSMNGKTTEGPSAQEFESISSKMETGLGFAPSPFYWEDPLIPRGFVQVPCSGPVASNVKYNYIQESGLQVRQVASQTITCDTSKKAYELQFSNYVYARVEGVGVLTLVSFSVQFSTLPPS